MLRTVVIGVCPRDLAVFLVALSSPVAAFEKSCTEACCPDEVWSFGVLVPFSLFNGVWSVWSVWMGTQQFASCGYRACLARRFGCLEALIDEGMSRYAESCNGCRQDRGFGVSYPSLNCSTVP